MKKVFKYGTMLGCFLLASSACLAASMKVGVVDLHEVFAKAPEVRVIKQNLETRFKPRQQKLMEMQTSIKSDVDKLQKEGSVMSSADKKALQEKIVKQQQDLEKKGSEYQQDLNTAQNRAMETFFTKVKGVIDTLAKKEQYTLVLQRDNVPYMQENLDITKKVLAAL